MLKITLIISLLFSNVVFSQVKDGFDDGDFSQNPEWFGDLNRFQVNVQKQLQSNGQQLANQTLGLSTANESAVNTKWEFSVQLNFDPTTTNFVRIYLCADQQDLKGTLNGYFIQIGETGTADGIHLYRQNGSVTTKIMTGNTKVRANANVFTARIKVTTDFSGNWTVYSTTLSDKNYTLEGIAKDQIFSTPAFMGIYCKYATASRYNQFIFDDFVVEDLLPDLIPPKLDRVSILNPSSLELYFSEALNSSALQPERYILSGGYGTPEKVSGGQLPGQYVLTYAQPFITGNYRITVKDVEDKKGNVIGHDGFLDFFYIKPYQTKSGDLVINEIFANPTGSPGLPQKEFAELWNTTNEYILTKGWVYSDQTSKYSFLTDTIKPGQYVILCAKTDVSLFAPYGKTVGLSPWPSLNNDRDILTLRNDEGTVIDQVLYEDNYYKDELKKKGGYSLELIDPDNLCKGIQNWSASEALSGETPGQENSIFKSQLSKERPKLFSASFTDSVTIQIVFSKSIDGSTAMNPANYKVNNGIGQPVSVIVGADLKTATLSFSDKISRGVEHTLLIDHVRDCAGNSIDQAANSAKLFMAKQVLKDDILISEVLFNPNAKGADFVEIFNNSDHVLDLKDLQLANMNTEGKPANIKSINNGHVFLPPHTYWILTGNMENIRANYFIENPQNFTQMFSLPNYNNDRGQVILLRDSQIIDQFSYTEKMQHPLLQITKGVSLERVSFSKGANEPGNFKSAAATAGFATPTYRNSQQEGEVEAFVKLSSKIFSPDRDGPDHVMKLNYQLIYQESMATIAVYTDKGKLVRTLLNNQSIGMKGSLTWDGRSDSGELLGAGIYIVLFDVFDPQGNAKRYSNTCVLAKQLN